MAAEPDADPLDELTREEKQELVDIVKSRRGDHISRRDALKAAGLIGSGAVLGGGASAAALDATGQASAGTAESGTIGTDANPVDAHIEDLSGPGGPVTLQNAIDANSQDLNNINSISGAGGPITLQNDIAANQQNITNLNSLTTDEITNIKYASGGEIQAAINDLNSARGKVIIRTPDDAGYPINEDFDISTQGITVESMGHNTHILNDADATQVDITAQDCTLRDVWIDNAGASGHAISAGQEAALERIDIDESPEHGLFIDADEVTAHAIWLTGGPFGGDAIRLGPNAKAACLSDINIDFGTAAGAPTHGIVLESSQHSITGAHIEGCEATGVEINSGVNLFEGRVEGSGDHGIVTNGGSDNIVRALVRNPTNDALRVIGTNQSTFVGFWDGDILLDTNTNNNVVIGRCTGTLTDNGTGNDTSLVT